MTNALTLIQVKELIQKKYNKEKTIDVKEITSDAPYKINSTRFFIVSYSFNIDPTPWDFWILVDEKKLYPGIKITKILQEKKIFPKSNNEALEIARLIAFIEGYSNISFSAVKKTSKGFEVVLRFLETSIYSVARGQEYTIANSDGKYLIAKKPIK